MGLIHEVNHSPFDSFEILYSSFNIRIRRNPESGKKINTIVAGILVMLE